MDPTTTTNTSSSTPTSPTAPVAPTTAVAPASPPTSPHVDHEATLTGVIALAALFSNCVEAFGLIHPSAKWEREEQLLLCRLGLQQARLLIWGDVTGVSSPPASVTDRAVPKHPSAAYPDVQEPTFFGPRDPRLDDGPIRTQIENALGEIADRSSHTTREEMMAKYGLKPPKKFAGEASQTLDASRLEGFRERFELLREVAESYAGIGTTRNSSITKTAWCIADLAKFEGFIRLTQEKVDLLISLLDVKERVDRGMRMDIKGLGWHLSADRARVASDVSKLRLITEVAKLEYPEYSESCKIALDNIDRERRENVLNYNPYAHVPLVSDEPLPPSARRGSLAQTNGATNGAANKHSKPAHGGLFGLFKFGRSKSSQATINAGRSQSVSAATATPPSDHEDPARSMSHPGHISTSAAVAAEEEDLSLEPVRSKSVGAILETPTEAIRSKSVGDVLNIGAGSEEEKELLRLRLEQMDTNATVPDDERGDATGGLTGEVSRHDQYYGLGRQGTKVQWD